MLAETVSAPGLPPDTVLTWLWTDPRYRGERYTAEHVERLRRMVERHYRLPHRFACVTNLDLPAHIERIPLADLRLARLRSPHGSRYPSCYRRLRMFAPGAGEVFGQRFISLDLDLVLLDDVTELWSRPEPFVAWRDLHPRCLYNGSMMMLTAGAHPRVWTDFNPDTSPHMAVRKYNGSDQGWISYRLGPGHATWTGEDGVYSFRHQIRDRELPENAKIVVFHGNVKPWHEEAQALPWVREHWGTA